MKRRGGWLLLVLLALAASAAPVDPVAVQELLRNARVWQQLGRDDKLRLVYQKLLAIDAGQPQALLGLTELALREGKSGEAQRLLAQLQRSTSPDAAAASADGQELLRLYTRELPRLQQLRLLRRGGQTERAAALARELFPGGRAPGALGVEFAGLLGGSGSGSGSRRIAGARPAAGRSGPARPPAAAPAAPSAPTTLPDDGYWPLLRQAQDLRDAGRLAEAGERAAAAGVLRPIEPEGALLRAELDARQGRTEAAITAYRALIDDPAVRARAVSRLADLLQQGGRVEEALQWAARTHQPDVIDIGAVRQAAEREQAQGRTAAAIGLLEAALALRPAEPWLRHDLARLHVGLGQTEPAHRVLAEGPPTAEMRYAAALAYAAWGEDEQALATLAAVPEADRSEGQRALVTRLRDAQTRRVAEAAAQAGRDRADTERRRAERTAWRQPTEEAALFPFNRRATDGLSTLRGLELPVVVTRPIDEPDSANDAPRAHRWLHVDAVRLDAGTLAPDLDSASPFGTVLASGQALPAGLSQRARGLNVGFGHSGDEQRWDIGVVGAGFEVPNLVGGWRRPFTLAGQDLSVELSRRVLTGSLLTYAGTRDPVSGRRWGGVTLSAASLRWSGDSGAWSQSASLRAGWLDGRNVASNDTVQLRLATDRDTLDTPTLRLNVGVALSVWRYRRNLGFHSFGQGGYYSPQRYTSLVLPLQATGRQGLWSYNVRGTLGRSWTYEADTPYYPTDAALQAGAGQPMHDGGGRGGGTSRSLRADLERRLSPHWSAGASFSADRSAYYAPTQWLFYLRHHGAAQGGPVPLPRPLQPYSQF